MDQVGAEASRNEQIWQRRVNGASVREIATEFGLSRPRIWQILRNAAEAKAAEPQTKPEAVDIEEEQPQMEAVKQRMALDEYLAHEAQRATRLEDRLGSMFVTLNRLDGTMSRLDGTLSRLASDTRWFDELGKRNADLVSRFNTVDHQVSNIFAVVQGLRVKTTELQDSAVSGAKSVNERLDFVNQRLAELARAIVDLSANTARASKVDQPQPAKPNTDLRERLVRALLDI